jgi:signal transduction histidine kinase
MDSVSGQTRSEDSVPIEEYRRLDALYRVRAETAKACSRAVGASPFLDEIARILVEHGGLAVAWIGLVQPDESLSLTALAGAARGYAIGLGLTRDERVPEGRGPSGIALRTGRTYVCNDFQRDPATQHWHARAQAFGLRASAAFPLRRGGQVVGLLAVYSFQAGHFGPREVELLQDVADDVCAGLDAAARSEALADAEARTRVALECLAQVEKVTNSGSFRIGLPGGEVWWSTGVNTLLGLPPGTRPSLQRLRAAVSAAAIDMLEAAVRQGHEGGRSLQVDLQIRTPHGETRWVEVYATPEHRLGGALEISGLVRGVDERKRLERAVVEAAAAERARIGADLHDDLGQVLTGLGLQLHACARRAARGDTDGIGDELSRLEQLAADAREACRRLARSCVSPPANDSLADRLQSMATDLPAPFTCDVSVPRTLPPGLPPDAPHELYRICQEALTNAIRHSGGTRLVIQMETQTDRVDLVVSDDGSGMRPRSRTGGLGLASMQSRASRLGGIMRIERTPGGGTTIRVSIPRARPAEN